MLWKPGRVLLNLDSILNISYMLISVFLITLNVNCNLQCMMLVLAPRRMKWYPLEEDANAAMVHIRACSSSYLKQHFNSWTWNPPPLSSFMYIHVYNRRWYALWGSAVPKVQLLIMFKKQFRSTDRAVHQSVQGCICLLLAQAEHSASRMCSWA